MGKMPRGLLLLPLGTRAHPTTQSPHYRLTPTTLWGFPFMPQPVLGAEDMGAIPQAVESGG